MKKTKIMAIGDVHGDTGLIKRLAQKAEKENVDIVILAGDFTLAERSTEGMVGPFIGANKRVLIIPGNHESIATADFLAMNYPNTKNIHGSGFLIDGLGIFGAGTANMGIHQIGDSGIATALKNGHEEISGCKRKVMVTHIHPYGSKAEMFGFRGSQAVRKALSEFKPNILISAHIHEAGGMEEILDSTTVFNVSKRERIFEI